jgi:RHS repeat-associated protein
MPRCREHYWGSTPIAFYYNDGSLHFQHQDWKGTERVRTSYSGGTEGSYYSLPWGDGYNANGSDNDPYHFAQLDRDSETDTHHAQFRQFSSTQGRWMSPDPYDGSYDGGNPQSLKRYSYALNNPLRFVDPKVLFCEYEDDAGDGLLESVDYNSSSGECASTGGDWYPDGWGSAGGTVFCCSNVGASGGVSGASGASGPAPNNDPDNARILALAQGITLDTKFVQCFQITLNLRKVPFRDRSRFR